MPAALHQGEVEGQPLHCPMTEHERRLRYFQKFQQEILQRLQITQPPETLTDEDRVGLAGVHLDLMSS